MYGASVPDDDSAVNEMVKGWLEAGADEKEVQQYLDDRAAAYENEPTDDTFDVYDCNWHATQVFLLSIYSWERRLWDNAVMGFKAEMVWQFIPKVIDRIKSIDAPDELHLYTHVMKMGVTAAQAIREMKA